MPLESVKSSAGRLKGRAAGIDHLTITVGNFAKSKAFCAPLMEFLGFDLQYDGSDMVGWTNGKTHFWIAAADAEGNKHKYHKGDIGFHHYGFRLRSRKDVDALEAFLEKHGPKIGIWPANITTTIAPCFSSIPTA